MERKFNSFESRYKLSDIIAQKLRLLLNNEDVEIMSLGMENICNNEKVAQFLLSDDSRNNFSAMILKFAPDFVMLHKKTNELYYIEIKTSLTPLCLETNRKQMKKIDNAIPQIIHIAEMDRDAWNTYKNYFPRTIIIDACLYNPNLLLCQFTERVMCLRCFDGYRKAFDCGQCPVIKGRVFPFERNKKSEGSKTPHMNYSLKNFIPFEEFFKKFNVGIDKRELEEVLNEIKRLELKFPKIITSETKKSITNELIEKGCYWLKK